MTHDRELSYTSIDDMRDLVSQYQEEAEKLKSNVNKKGNIMNNKLHKNTILNASIDDMRDLLSQYQEEADRIKKENIMNNKLHKNTILNGSTYTITQPSLLNMVVFMFKLISATLVAVLPFLWAIALIVKYFKYAIR